MFRLTSLRLIAKAHTLSVVLAIVCSLILMPAAVGQPQNQWKVGFAEADITPADGEAVMLAGFGRPRVVKGREAPLVAQAVAFEDAAGNRAVLFSADVLGFGRNTVDLVRSKLKASHGIRPEAVCLSASHTHWGPAINEKTGGAIGEINVWYVAFLEQQLLQLADRALSSISAADIFFSSTEAAIGMCRRTIGNDGKVRWAPEPTGSYDAHTPIVRIERQQDPQELWLVGHACHPTSRGASDVWSPDYPGAMRRKIESARPNSRAIFLQGCGGDAKVVIKNPTTGVLEFAADPLASIQAGEKLAESVLNHFSRSVDEKGSVKDSRIASPTKDPVPEIKLQPSFSAVLESGELSLQESLDPDELRKLAYSGASSSYTTWWARKMLAFPDNRRSFEYDIQAWQLGELTMIALEGEVCSEWGPAIRSLVNNSNTPTKPPQAMVLGYANEVSSYIPNARIIHEGGYEGFNSHQVYLVPAPFDPQMESELTDIARRAIKRLQSQGLQK